MFLIDLLQLASSGKIPDGAEYEIPALGNTYHYDANRNQLLSYTYPYNDIFRDITTLDNSVLNISVEEIKNKIKKIDNLNLIINESEILDEVAHNRATIVNIVDTLNRIIEKINIEENK